MPGQPAARGLRLLRRLLADRFPFGPKPAATIRRFAHEIATHLAGIDTKLVVVACNAATSAALPELQREFAVPLIGVITPEARAAVQVTRTAGSA